ncbi:hypothetical protein ACLMNJ_27300 [Streptomyces seoulensis]
MRELTNLAWPETPYGSVTRPVQKPGTWLTSLSLLWGEHGNETVLMGAAAVFMKIHRTQPLAVSEPLAHFGYRVLVPDGMGQTAEIIRHLDVILVQARRKSQIIAWHNGADDLHVLANLPRTEGEPRHPGVIAVGDGWKDRTTRDRGTAFLVDTSHDLGPAGLSSETAARHTVIPMDMFAGARQQEHAQEACVALAEGQFAQHIDALAVSVLSSAVTTALLGGKHTGRLCWEEPLSVFHLLSHAAWKVAPSLLTGAALAHDE